MTFSELQYTINTIHEYNIIIIFITYTPGTNKHTHEKNKILK